MKGTSSAFMGILVLIIAVAVVGTAVYLGGTYVTLGEAAKTQPITLPICEPGFICQNGSRCYRNEHCKISDCYYCQYGCFGTECGCAQTWVCSVNSTTGESMKCFQNNDCSKTNCTNCEYGCYAGSCNPAPCNAQWVCNGSNKCYQNLDCSTTNCTYCEYGCTNGTCTPQTLQDCPITLYATLTPNSQTKLDWTSICSEATFYRLNYRIPNGTWTWLKDLRSNTSSFTTTEYGTYEYRVVVAKGTSGELDGKENATTINISANILTSTTQCTDKCGCFAEINPGRAASVGSYTSVKYVTDCTNVGCAKTCAELYGDGAATCGGIFSDSRCVGANGGYSNPPSVSIPELIVSSFGYTPLKPIEGNVVYLTSVIENIGDAITGTFYVKTDCGYGANNIQIATINPLKVGDSVNVTYACNNPKYSAGTYNATVIVDVYNNVSEINKSNNFASNMIVVNKACTTGYVCNGSNRCYQNEDCSLTNCAPCTYGCIDGICKPSPCTITLYTTLTQDNRTMFNWTTCPDADFYRINHRTPGGSWQWTADYWPNTSSVIISRYSTSEYRIIAAKGKSSTLHGVENATTINISANILTSTTQCTDKCGCFAEINPGRAASVGIYTSVKYVTDCTNVGCAKTCAEWYGAGASACGGIFPDSRCVGSGGGYANAPRTCSPCWIATTCSSIWGSCTTESKCQTTAPTCIYGLNYTCIAEQSVRCCGKWQIPTSVYGECANCVIGEYVCNDILRTSTGLNKAQGAWFCDKVQSFSCASNYVQGFMI